MSGWIGDGILPAPPSAPGWRNAALAAAITAGIMLLSPAAFNPAVRAPARAGRRLTQVETVPAPQPPRSPAPQQRSERERAASPAPELDLRRPPESGRVFAPLLPNVNLAPDLASVSSPLRLSFGAETDMGLEGGLSEIFELSQLDVAPNPVFQPPPVYPPHAELQGLEGAVSLEFVVTSAGEVADVAVAASSPPGIFEQAAAQAVRRWRFRPGMRGGSAVRARVRQNINFRIQR